MEGWCIDVKYSQSTNHFTTQYSKSDKNWAGIFQIDKMVQNTSKVQLNSIFQI